MSVVKQSMRIGVKQAELDSAPRKDGVIKAKATNVEHLESTNTRKASLRVTSMIEQVLCRSICMIWSLFKIE